MLRLRIPMMDSQPRPDLGDGGLERSRRKADHGLRRKSFTCYQTGQIYLLPTDLTKT